MVKTVRELLAEIPKRKTVGEWLELIRKKKPPPQPDPVSPRDRRYNVYSAAAFVVLMVFIGLPVWWLTTRVYRASLPYQEIAEFEHATLILPVSVSLIAGDDTVEKVLRDDAVAAKLKRAVSKELNRVIISLDLDERKCSEVERPILSSKVESFAELESALYLASISTRRGKIRSQDIKGDGVEIFLLHRPNSKRRVHFGSSTRVFVIGDWESGMREELSDLLVNIILNGYLRVDGWMATVARHMKDDLKLTANTPKTSLSTGTLHPKMTLELHVVDPEPIPCSERFVADQIVEDGVVKEFLSAISDISAVSVKSQILYDIDFGYEPIANQQSSPPFYYLDPARLQHMINPIETYLSTSVTNEPVYHMLLYLPQSSVHPLMVVDAKLRPMPYNSFVVSGWGSVSVVNANRTCPRGETLIIDRASMKAAKTAIVANLKKYFGLHFQADFERTPTPLADWEIQSLRYQALVEYMFSSMRTLKSLTKLLDEITNIVINDEIGASIDLAVSEMQSVLIVDPKAGTGHWRIHSMLKSAARAFEESEKAFFDPSLLALLYFPDDQKYAIYVPLFLPIGMPVLGSILFIWNYFKKLSSEKVKEA